ncbi:MAG: alpha/beta hydrolase [Burkholderiaceae bacterium]
MTIVGTSLPYYLEEGLGSRVILMLHGIGGGHQAFAPQMSALAAHGWRALAWDMPGYGYSRTVEPYTMESLAQSCLDLIAVLDVGPVVLLGHSMGGMVAQEVAARAPEAVAGLVLAATSPAFGSRDGPWQKAFLTSRTAPLDAGKSMAQLARTLVLEMVAEKSAESVVRALTNIMAAVPAATYRHALGALVEFDRRAELDSIRVPTLVVAGKSDRNAPPAVMEKMAGRIPRAHYRTIEGAGHLLHWEQPDAFNAILVAFLDECFPLPHASEAP